MKVPQIDEHSAPKSLTEVEVITEVKSHGLWLHPGEKRKIDSRLAPYFAHHGWVKLQDAEAAPLVPTENASLDVQNGSHNSSVSNAG